MHEIKMKQPLVLASSSPRRKQLLELLNVPFNVVDSNVDETVEFGPSPAEIAKMLANRKAQSVANMIGPGHIVIGADTIVVLNHRVLGKPNDRNDAIEMLLALQGKVHEVFTGIAIIDDKNSKELRKEIVQVSRTLVHMRKLTLSQIENYVDSGEPMDKAGAYAIQGFGSVFVESIEGCYFNVVGLPVSLFVNMMEELGYSLL
jgi:septum formation protein